MSASAATNDALLPASRSTYILQFPWSLICQSCISTQRSNTKHHKHLHTRVHGHFCYCVVVFFSFVFYVSCKCVFLALSFMPARHLCLFTLSLRVHACLPVCMHMSCAVKTNMRPLNWHVSRVGEKTTIPCHPGSAYLYTTFLSCGHSFVQVLSSSCWFKYPLSRKWKFHTHRQNENSSKALFPTPSQYAACKPQMLCYIPAFV